MRCKEFTASLFTVVGLIVKTITSIEKPKGSLEVSVLIG